MNEFRQIYGSRLQATGFSQFGGFGKLLARLGETQNLTVSYRQTVQEGVRGYKDLYGGLGRPRSGRNKITKLSFYNL